MELQDKILSYLNDFGPTSSLEIAKKFEIDHLSVVGSIKSLDSLQNVVELEQYQDIEFILTEEGNYILINGSHEFVVYNSVPVNSTVAASEISNCSPYAKVGLSKALAAKWLKLEKTPNDTVNVKRIAESVEDVVQQCLQKIHDLNLDSLSSSDITDMKKRKLLTEAKRTWYKIKKGANFTLNIKKAELDLTHEMISTGSWSELDFKPYNFNAKGVPPEGGHLHPLLRVRTEFTRILMEMGFVEMPTNNYIESSFWNFDALFQPQQHPARDAHDTFFVSDPAITNIIRHCPPEYVDLVSKVHSKGGYGSVGYQYDWKIEEAQKNILRTHTTAVSTRMLYKLANTQPIKPIKYFSIDRVFRNEALDATHLAEFHQVEGVVADFGIGLGHLKAVIRAFFSKLGLTQLKFKPAYNPYTEPSMEIFSFHPGLNKWVEIGNSGVFRPEMLRPMGLPPNLNVIAWGLSLERPTMIRYGYKNIRDLIGPKIDLSMVYNSPICRIEKN